MKTRRAEQSEEFLRHRVRLLAWYAPVAQRLYETLFGIGGLIEPCGFSSENKKICFQVRATRRLWQNPFVIQGSFCLEEEDEECVLAIKGPLREHQDYPVTAYDIMSFIQNEKECCLSKASSISQRMQDAGGWRSWTLLVDQQEDGWQDRVVQGDHTWIHHVLDDEDMKEKDDVFLIVRIKNV